MFRHYQEEHANLQATLEASRGTEGRFHVRREFGAIYIAADRETALAELDTIAAIVAHTRTVLAALAAA